MRKFWSSYLLPLWQDQRGKMGNRKLFFMQSPLSREAMLALSRRGSIKCHDLQNPTFDTFSGKISNVIEETKATDTFAFFQDCFYLLSPLLYLQFSCFGRWVSWIIQLILYSGICHIFLQSEIWAHILYIWVICMLYIQ